MKRVAHALAWLAALAVALGASAVAAHPLAPSLLELREHVGGRVEVSFKTPLFTVPGARLEPALPEHCAQATPPRETLADDSLTLRWNVDCGARGLVGERVGMNGLAESRTDALVRISLADGRSVQRVLRARAPFFEVPRRPGTRRVVADYLGLGFEHILTGLDHLLFVFGLLLLVHGARPLVATVTAFTVGHSVTLCLAVLGVVRVPTRPVEVLIALSIFVLALELARSTQHEDLLRRFPWALAGLFGLLHGLGFAGALAEVGLPEGEIPLALLSFNLGIEAGQLVFVALVLVGRLALKRLPRPLPAWSARVPVYVMGSLAWFWVLERSAALLR